MENPIKMDDLGVPPFMETSISLFDSNRGCHFLLLPKKKRRCGLPELVDPKLARTGWVTEIGTF